MKRLQITLTLTAAAAMLVLSGCGKKTGDQSNHSDQGVQKSTTQEERLIYYTCPMDSHKHIHSSEAGRCSECSMELVAAVVTSEDKMDFYGCPMEAHSHVRQDSPGICEGCGMTLEPMRLKKD